jgi:hypothetical protein
MCIQIKHLPNYVWFRDIVITRGFSCFCHSRCFKLLKHPLQTSLPPVGGRDLWEGGKEKDGMRGKSMEVTTHDSVESQEYRDSGYFRQIIGTC